jgi:hypothetical protein
LARVNGARKSSKLTVEGKGKPKKGPQKKRKEKGPKKEKRKNKKKWTKR